MPDQTTGPSSSVPKTPRPGAVLENRTMLVRPGKGKMYGYGQRLIVRGRKVLIENGLVWKRLTPYSLIWLCF